MAGGAITDWIGRLLDGSIVQGSVFLLIGIIGALLLILPIVLDGIFEVFDFGDGPLSLTTIAACTAIFGFTSFAMVGAGASATVAGVVGAGAEGVEAAFIADAAADTAPDTAPDAAPTAATAPDAAPQPKP